MAGFRPKRTGIIAVRRMAFTPSQPIRVHLVGAVSVADMVLETSNKVQKSEQTVQEINNKILLVGPVITKVLSYPPN